MQMTFSSFILPIIFFCYQSFISYSHIIFLTINTIYLKKIFLAIFSHFGGGYMNWKSFFLGAAVGMASGYLTKEILSQNTKVTPEKVLGLVKKQFRQHGPISGSWIHMTAEPYVKNHL